MEARRAKGSPHHSWSLPYRRASRRLRKTPVNGRELPGYGSHYDCSHADIHRSGHRQAGADRVEDGQAKAVRRGVERDHARASACPWRCVHGELPG